jgi:Fe2+ transport system protein FeoA
MEEQRRRLMDLGVIPGTIVAAEMASPMGDPTAYRIRGALIALRKDQAGLIVIEPEELHGDNGGN